MKLEFLMEYTATLEAPQEIGAGPRGTRRIFPVTGGEFQGPKLNGKILPGGGDWLTVDSGGAGRLDVRVTFETGDGALIYLAYEGVLVFNEAILGGQGADYGDTYFMTAPRFETGDDRYKWLNTAICVGEGKTAPGRVSYRVYQAVNG